jgi:hypothetical protein
VAFRLGAAVAVRLGGRAGWGDKIEILLDLLDAAPAGGQQAVTALRVLQQPLIDILGVHGELDEILGRGLALGDQLLILLQIASAPAAVPAAALGRTVARPGGLAARLALTLHGRPVFTRTRRAIGRRVLAALAGDRPLWPGHPAREAEGLQAVVGLLAAAGRLLDQDEVAAALARRRRRLAGPVFVDARLGLRRRAATIRADAAALGGPTGRYAYALG